jgi:opacity protein-like surface antigen
MRKLICVTFTLLFLFVLAGSALASDLPSPVRMLPAGQFSLGVSSTWQSEQRFKDSDITTNLVYANGSRSSSASGFNDLKLKDDAFYLATLSYGVTDCLNVFARAGVASGAKEKYSWFDNGRWSPVEVKLADAFTWGLGAKARLFETPGGLGVTLSAQYLRYDNRDEQRPVVNGAGLTSDSFDYQADYQQVDAVAALYQRLGAFTPYLGLGYQWARFQFSGTFSMTGQYTGSGDFSTTNQYNLAALVGCDLALGERLSLNAQASFVSHTAVGLGFSYLF